MLSAVLKALVDRAEEAVDALEALSFNPDLHAVDSRRLCSWCERYGNFVNTPVINAETGEPTARVAADREEVPVSAGGAVVVAKKVGAVVEPLQVLQSVVEYADKWVAEVQRS